MITAIKLRNEDFLEKMMLCGGWELQMDIVEHCYKLRVIEDGKPALYRSNDLLSMDSFDYHTFLTKLRSIASTPEEKARMEDRDAGAQAD